MTNTINISTPVKKLKYPKSIGFIVSNEFCERFSYYGMRTILALYLRSKLGFTENGATIVYHTFSMLAYFFPLIGAIIADGFLGRYRTILYLSWVYAAGFILISLTAVPPLNIPGVPFTVVALGLIAFGTGGIKPCVSAFGGDQFKLPEQERFLATFFSLYYFAINSGSLLSTFITPILRLDVHCFGDNDCYSLAFGVPGVLMVLSIIIFIAGKRLYTIKNPSGNIFGQVIAVIWTALVGKVKSKNKKEHWLDHASEKHDGRLVEDVKSLMRVLVLFIPLPVFWTLFDQQGSRWTFQAERMDQRIGSWSLKPDQMQVLNPLLILAFIPIFETAIYPVMTKLGLISKPLHKMIWGGFLAAAAFVISGVVELKLLPTYGTPVTEGIAQLRIYNGFPCEFVLNSSILPEPVTIGSIGLYEQLDIETESSIDMPYTLLGQGACLEDKFEGNFSLSQKTANSFFIRKGQVEAFIDNNNKALDGVNLRILSNTPQVRDVQIINANNGEVKRITSNSTEQLSLNRGMYQVMFDNTVVVERISVEVGAVVAINVYEHPDGMFESATHEITPPNSIHILWLIPQYVVMTMGEVMFSVTGLEFAFTQAPLTMKSVLQSMWLITVAFGNLIVILIVHSDILDAQWKEFFLFAGLMAIDMVIFSLMALRYKYVTLASSEESLGEELKSPTSMTDRDLSTKMQ